MHTALWIWNYFLDSTYSIVINQKHHYRILSKLWEKFWFWCSTPPAIPILCGNCIHILIGLWIISFDLVGGNDQIFKNFECNWIIKISVSMLNSSKTHVKWFLPFLGSLFSIFRCNIDAVDTNTDSSYKNIVNKT